MTKPRISIVSLLPSDLPAFTLAGVVWSPLIIKGKHVDCEYCILFEQCRAEVDSGNFAGCERMLEDEIWPEPPADDLAPVVEELDESLDIPEMVDWGWASR